MNIQKILAHPRMMKAVTRLSRIEFDDLAVPFDQAVMENKRRASTAVSRKFARPNAGRGGIERFAARPPHRSGSSAESVGLFVGQWGGAHDSLRRGYSGLRLCVHDWQRLPT